MPAAVAASPLGAPSASGLGLRAQFARAERRRRMRALGLVLPLLAFITVTFLAPVADMLVRSGDNRMVGEILPRAAPLIRAWNPADSELPPDDVFSAMLEDLRDGAKAKTITRLGQRLNYEASGLSSLFRKSARRVRKLVTNDPRAALLKMDKKWGERETWMVMRKFSGNWTPGYYQNAFDFRYDAEADSHKWADEERRIYLKLFARTLALSALITLMTFLLGYPVAFMAASLPARTANLMMILVLLPFWTSLLVRTTSWIALLQEQGVINDILVAAGIIGDDGRLRMIHNQVGTVVAMTHILLPFMILPLYSVMKTISPSYMRAARSMGANAFTAFRRVYFPQTIPGMGAGAILVFILSIGYYITPELVGGRSGTFISNRIAYHISSSLNWGLGEALGFMLLALVLALYWAYDRVVGVDKMRLG